MHLRVFMFGLPLVELVTGTGAKDAQQEQGPSGAEAYTERRPSEDTAWQHVGFGVPEDRR